MNRFLRIGGGVLLAFTLFALSVVNLESVPPLWWDEGWTLTSARNWLERGHYGPFLNGRPAPRVMEGAFPITLPVAISFRLLGVGVYQARIPGVCYTLLTLGLIYYLAQRLYNRSVALATLLVLTFMPAYFGLHPILTGRQVLGEMPSLFYLLAGYACFLSVRRGPVQALALASCFWAVALVTKAQVLPFWAVSMFIPSMFLLHRRDWKSAALFVLAFGIAVGGSWLLILLWQFFIGHHTLPATPVSGLYPTVALVTSIPARLFGLIVIFFYGMPTLAGLCYTCWDFLMRKDELQTHTGAIRLSLLALAGSWFAWYAIFSISWIRYLFPPVFVGSVFVAAMLSDLTNRFNLSYTIRQSASAFGHFRFRWESMGALLAVVLVATSVPRTLVMFYKTYVLDADTSVQQVAQFLNTETAPGALIETYDSELFFFLKRRYHFPPDQVHVELIRRTFLYQDNVRIDYNPLVANPDYLVVGPHSRQWHLYDPVLKTGSFRLLRTYTRYDLYERPH